MTDWSATVENALHRKLYTLKSRHSTSWRSNKLSVIASQRTPERRINYYRDEDWTDPRRQSRWRRRRWSVFAARRAVFDVTVSAAGTRLSRTTACVETPSRNACVVLPTDSALSPHVLSRCPSIRPPFKTNTDRLTLHVWVYRSSLLSGCPLVSHGEYADGTDSRTDGRTKGRQTVTLCFPLDAFSVKI